MGAGGRRASEEDVVRVGRRGEPVALLDVLGNLLADPEGAAGVGVGADAAGDHLQHRLRERARGGA